MKTKKVRKIKGTLSAEALEVLSLPKDILAASKDFPDKHWSGQDIRKVLLQALVTETLGDMMQQARQARKVTGETLGKRIGVSKARIAQLEGLEGGQVELQTLAQYAHALGYKVNINFVPENEGQVFSAVL